MRDWGYSRTNNMALEANVHVKPNLSSPWHCQVAANGEQVDVILLISPRPLTKLHTRGFCASWTTMEWEGQIGDGFRIFWLKEHSMSTLKVHPPPKLMSFLEFYKEQSWTVLVPDLHKWSARAHLVRGTAVCRWLPAISENNQNNRMQSNSNKT
jgi:hypothetical protein